MTNENGLKLQRAIKAVCQMHSDVSKLLIEFDNLVPWASESVFGNFATRDLTYNARAKFWMAEAVYRFLASKTEAGVVEAITVCFTGPAEFKEPLLLLGRIQYRVAPGAKITDVCEGWDLWNLCFTWNKNVPLGSAVQCAAPEDGRIAAARVIAVPLYSITSMTMVADYLSAVRTAAAGVNGH